MGYRGAINRRLVTHRLDKEAGLTLLEIAAAIDISIVLAIVIVVAITGVFRSAKHSSVIQTLTNISTAAYSYAAAEGDPSASPDFGPTALSRAYPGVTFITSAPSSATSTDVYASSLSGVTILAMYDPSTSNCVYVADSFIHDPDSVWSSAGVWWSAPGGAPCSYVSGGSLLVATNLYYNVTWTRTPPAN